MASPPENWEELLAEKDRRIAKLEAQVKELLARLGQNSTNSSKPPSQDRGPDRKKRKKKKSERRRGGQKGHKGRTREMLPPEQVDETFDYIPVDCAKCGAKLHGQDEEPRRVQMVELPPIEPHVVEHRLHTLECMCCGARTAAEQPEETRHGMCGPRLAAFITMLTGSYHLSKRATQTLVVDLLGLELALGTVSNLEKRTSAALAEPVRDVKAAILESPVLYIDETGWTEDKMKAWAWAMATPSLAYFEIDQSRGADVAHDLLDGYEGIVVSDRLGSYGWIPPEDRQVCWAHLDRTFRGLAERDGELGQFGAQMSELTKALWRHWKAMRLGDLEEEQFRRKMTALKWEFRKTLRAWAPRGILKVSGMCQNLLDIEPALWNFVDHPGVEPTNNEAERAVRPAVLWRKSSFGTDSVRGSRFVARMLTATMCLHKQGRRVFEYLIEVISAARAGASVPSLATN